MTLSMQSHYNRINRALRATPCERLTPQKRQISWETAAFARSIFANLQTEIGNYIDASASYEKNSLPAGQEFASLSGSFAVYFTLATKKVP